MSEPRKRVTVPSIRAAKGVRRIGMVTAYDHPSARIVDDSGADIILVGDSLAMVVLGQPDTLGVTMDEMLHHTRAAARGAGRALVVGDMPWLSYHLTTAETVRNAGAFIRAGAHAVKVEGGRPGRIEMIRAILDAEIPVMGHVGLTPQSVHTMGGFKVQGKGADEAKRLVDEAMALDQAGCFAIVLECVPAELAAWITDNVSVPTIGIGAGPACDGQVLVFHDLLGLYDGHKSKFVRRYAEAGETMRAAVSRFIEDVREGRFPDAASESFHVASEEELQRLYAAYGEGE
ncbi:MAG TPA: 3-methyl-2-oxobutanoate hydroxymethyltransferase [Thermoanaerobaculia bacterium]|nr:3-methyl-2-oxobutanoate hydroxymethyltransferase [Thermoanaerobaculia bacterium]